jgi:hypothetical protein
MNILGKRLGGSSAAGTFMAIVVAACSGSTTSVTPSGQPNNASGNDAGGSTNANNNGNNNTPPEGDDDDASTSDPIASSDGGPIGPVDASACSATPSEVVMIGDSYFALSGEITKNLQSLATAGGALASGSSYRHYYESGANMYPYPDAQVTPIPTQFNDAVTAGADIKYVIMDGGGNDILLQNSQCIEVSPDAGPISSDCVTVIDNAVSTAKTLFQTMKTAGVEKIIYFFYPHVPTTGKPSADIVLDYSYPLVKAACDDSPIPCFFIDTRAAFEGHSDYIGPDNIHPTTAGSDVIAGLIWSVMQQQCVAL